MNERESAPLVVAIAALLLAVISYAIRDERLAAVVYFCGLMSAGCALLQWFLTPKRRRI